MVWWNALAAGRLEVVHTQTIPNKSLGKTLPLGLLPTNCGHMSTPFSSDVTVRSACGKNVAKWHKTAQKDCDLKEQLWNTEAASCELFLATQANPETVMGKIRIGMSHVTGQIQEEKKTSADRKWHRRPLTCRSRTKNPHVPDIGDMSTLDKQRQVNRIVNCTVMTLKIKKHMGSWSKRPFNSDTNKEHQKTH